MTNKYLEKGTTYSLFSSLHFLYVTTTYVLDSYGPKATSHTFQTIWEFRNYTIPPTRGPRLWSLISSLVYKFLDLETFQARYIVPLILQVFKEDKAWEIEVLEEQCRQGFITLVPGVFLFLVWQYVNRNIHSWKSWWTEVCTETL